MPPTNRQTNRRTRIYYTTPTDSVGVGKNLCGWSGRGLYRLGPLPIITPCNCVKDMRDVTAIYWNYYTSTGPAAFRSVQTVQLNTAPQNLGTYILKSNFTASGHSSTTSV